MRQGCGRAGPTPRLAMGTSSGGMAGGASRKGHGPPARAAYHGVSRPAYRLHASSATRSGVVIAASGGMAGGASWKGAAAAAACRPRPTARYAGRRASGIILQTAER